MSEILIFAIYSSQNWMWEMSLSPCAQLSSLETFVRLLIPDPKSKQLHSPVPSVFLLPQFPLLCFNCHCLCSGYLQCWLKWMCVLGYSLISLLLFQRLLSFIFCRTGIIFLKYNRNHFHIQTFRRLPSPSYKIQIL